jgi:hypothetical protein
MQLPVRTLLGNPCARLVPLGARALLRVTLVSFLFLTAHSAALPAQQPPAVTDDQVRQAIIHESVSDYLATGHPCACPYNVDRGGHSCGRRSAYSRPGGASPFCYPADVTPGMVQDWRKAHR